jgi:aryl-alcohol dehydrogenase-like predicted oxidoreductase
MTNSEIALNYCLNQSNIDKVLIGVDTKNQLMENINGLKYLSLDIIDEINRIFVKNTKLLNPVNW